ncbi:MAG: oligosaccharide flippase family protein [Cytophagales bacterium]|nr:oligosaccharide flippase family protein [Cytophagales bacterium]
MIKTSKEVVKRLRKSYWLKSGTLVLSTRLILMIIGFITFLILIRYFDKEEYGIWVIYMTVTSLIETVRIGFLKSPLMILNSDKATRRDLLYANSFFLNILLSLLFIIAVVSSISIWSAFGNIGVIKYLFFLYSIKLIIVSVSDHFDLIQETNLEFKGSFFDLVSRYSVFVLLIFVFLFFGKTIRLELLVLFQIIGSVVGLILTSLNAYLKGIVALPSFTYNAVYLKKYVKLGKYTIGSSLISIASRNIDTWMLGLLMSPAAITIYNPALRVSNIFELPSSTVASVVMPKLTKEIGLEGISYLKTYYERSITYVLIVMIPLVILIFIFSDEIVYLLAGPGFQQSGELLKITIFFGLLIPFNRQFNVIMESARKPETSFLVMIFTLVVSIISHYIFILNYGIYGAAIGSLFAYFLVFILTQVYLNHHHGIRFWEIYLDVVPTFLKIRKRFIRTFKTN